MKKLLFVSAMMIGFIGFSAAQTNVKPAKPATNKVVQAKPASTAAPVKVVSPVTKPAAATAAKPVNAQGVVLKKDGTPDKRFNNAAAKPAGPVKKDGTADMRFKANKKNK